MPLWALLHVWLPVLASATSPDAIFDANFKIGTKGVRELKPFDVVLVFYISLTNIGHELQKISYEGTQCCQIITKLERDCETIELKGSETLEIYPQVKRELSLLFPNLYPYNRKGECTIQLEAIDLKVTRTVIIPFDTNLCRPHNAKYKDHLHVDHCSSVDEDPLRKCRPYECWVRYNGMRNYYNSSRRRCEKAPVCVPTHQGDEDTPDVMYAPLSNTCQTMLETLSDEDMATLNQYTKHVNERVVTSQMYPVRVNCNHGVKNPDNGWCTCEAGWESVKLDPRLFNPDIMTYQMCNKWVGTGDLQVNQKAYMSSEEESGFTILYNAHRHHPKTFAAKIMVLGIAALVLLILILIFSVLFWIEKKRNKCRKSKDKRHAASAFRKSKYSQLR